MACIVSDIETPMFGCCGPSIIEVGKFQRIQVTKAIPPTGTTYMSTADIDAAWAAADARLAAEPFPGVYSSNTFITIDASGNESTEFSQTTNPVSFPIQSFAVASWNYTQNPPLPQSQPVNSATQFFQGGSVSVQKIRYVIRAPWSSYLGRTAMQPFGTRNNCIQQLGGDLFEVELSMAGHGSTSICFAAYHGPFGYISFIRDGTIISGAIC